MQPTVVAAIVTAIAAASVPVIKVLAERFAAPKESLQDMTSGSTSSPDIQSAVPGNLIQSHSVVTCDEVPAPLTVVDLYPTKVPSRPSGKEIVECIRAAKPFDQIQICKNYVGLRVSWPVRFLSISIFGDLWFVIFINHEQPRVFVSAHVSIDKYPKLKILDQNHPCWIEGQIERTEWDSVRLENDPTISLDPDATSDPRNAYSMIRATTS